MFQDTFVAGIDTSAKTIHWAMAEPFRHPRVLKKVQEEIRTAVGRKERVQSEDMSKLTYLRMVVKETLRLRIPAALLVPRETLRKIQIAGYDIPAKTRVLVNAWAIARDPNVWKDPEEFYPEGYEDTDI